MNTARKSAKKVDIRVLMREDEHNRRARAILRRYYRSILDMTQEQFAAELSKEFHGRIALTTLSGYLTGRSNVPGSVLLAAISVVVRLTDLTKEDLWTQLLDAVLYEPTGRKRGGPSIVR